MSHLRRMWLILAVFLVFAVGSTLVALLLTPDGDPDPALQWSILALVVFSSGIALAVLAPRWFRGAPHDVAGAVLTGTFMRLAIVEPVFIIGWIMAITGIGDAAGLFAGLGVSVILTIVFVAPTATHLARLQEQLDRSGAIGDVVGELSQPPSP